MVHILHITEWTNSQIKFKFLKNRNKIIQVLSWLRINGEPENRFMFAKKQSHQPVHAPWRQEAQAWTSTKSSFFLISFLNCLVIHAPRKVLNPHPRPSTSSYKGGMPFELQLIGTLYQNLSKFKYAKCPQRGKTLHLSLKVFMSKSFSPTLG